LIGTGSKSLTIQTGKDIVVGMFILIARTSAPENYMAGQVTSYNSETGALAVFINSVGGSGTYTDWTISLSAITFDAATEAEMIAGTETAVRTMSPADIKTATKGIQMVASGTLTDGSVVSLNPDGTVSITYNVVPEAGLPVVFELADTRYISAAFDSLNNKVVIAYQDVGNANYGTAVVGTVSGTSISFGTPVVFESANAYYISAAFDSSSNKVVIAYQDAGNAYYGTAIVGTVSGTSISFGTPVVFESADTRYISAAFDSSSNKVVIAYQDAGNAYYGTAVTFDSYSYTNVPEWIGISSDAYLDTETATIFRIGDVANNQAGLTPNAVYYVDLDGTLTTNSAGGRKIGKALSATELLITEGNA
jgi:hypothetical protein